MRYIVLKTQVTDEGTLTVYGLFEVVQKASGFAVSWIELSQAKTNCFEPGKCDLLSFGTVEAVMTLLYESKMAELGNIAYIGVNIADS